MQNLETKLNEMLVKNAPFQLPEGVRKWLAEYVWIFAVIGLVFGVFGALGLLAVLGLVSSVGVVVGATQYVFFAWISLFALIAYLVVLGMAVPKLKNKQAGGWDLIFYSELAWFAYSVLYALSYIGAGAIFNLLWNLIGLTVSLYFLFQVREYFKGSKKVSAKK
jgi:hypothetical protein